MKTVWKYQWWITPTEIPDFNYWWDWFFMYHTLTHRHGYLKTLIIFGFFFQKEATHGT